MDSPFYASLATQSPEENDRQSGQIYHLSHPALLYWLLSRYPLPNLPDCYRLYQS